MVEWALADPNNALFTENLGGMGAPVVNWVFVMGFAVEPVGLAVAGANPEEVDVV